jgi:hypothetical protein
MAPLSGDAALDRVETERQRGLWRALLNRRNVAGVAGVSREREEAVSRCLAPTSMHACTRPSAHTQCRKLRHPPPLAGCTHLHAAMLHQHPPPTHAKRTRATHTHQTRAKHPPPLAGCTHLHAAMLHQHPPPTHAKRTRATHTHQTRAKHTPGALVCGPGLHLGGRGMLAGFCVARWLCCKTEQYVPWTRRRHIVLLPSVAGACLWGLRCSVRACVCVRVLGWLLQHGCVLRVAWSPSAPLLAHPHTFTGTHRDAAGRPPI